MKSVNITIQLVLGNCVVVISTSQKPQ